MCGETATGLVIEGHLHPYCAWQASEERRKRLREVMEDRCKMAPLLSSKAKDYMRYADQTVDVLRAALAADREGRL